MGDFSNATMNTLANRLAMIPVSENSRSRFNWKFGLLIAKTTQNQKK